MIMVTRLVIGVHCRLSDPPCHRIIRVRRPTIPGSLVGIDIVVFSSGLLTRHPTICILCIRKIIGFGSFIVVFSAYLVELRVGHATMMVGRVF